MTDPNNGDSRHNSATAVDITMVGASNNEVEMPSGFDEFSEKAYRDNPNMSEAARKNLNLLTATMTKCGFSTIDTEWWHYEDSNFKNSKVLDVQFDQFN